jgi:hypothetical protein
MIEPLLITSSMLLGHEFVKQTITKTTDNIYFNLNTILSDSDFEFKTLLEDLDINTKLDIIKTFISNININKKSNYYSTIEKTLVYINTIFVKIETEIDDIINEIKIHKLKWLYYLRSSPYNKQMNNLMNHMKIIENRFEILINLLKIN